MPQSLDLDQLAEDLNRREQSNPLSSIENAELPVHVPLAHANPFLNAESFNVEDFLLSRVHGATPADIRLELREYLASLKEELVKLINDDYAAFISLSSDLRGEGPRLERLKAPLSGLKGQVVQSRAELQAIQDAVLTKLKKRAELREEKAVVHLLLKISESITRLETLLLIAPPSQDAQNLPHFANVEEPEDTSRTNRAKHLARVATEYSQLLYHITKAEEESCEFVGEVKWRVDRIKSTLSTDLDHLFSNTIVALESKVAENERIKLVADMTECLRTYDTLELWRDAEDIVRKDIVLPFVKKTIFAGALTAPPSPLVPKTPLPASKLSVPFPHTPFTPVTAFDARHGAFSKLAAPVPLLDEQGDALAVLYNQIIRFIERDLVRLMETSERVSSTSTSGKFEIAANVVWSEVGRAIMEELGTVVFAAGRPEEFRKHHRTTESFLRTLEYLAPSTTSVEAIRTHAVFETFQKRWQLPIYFQLRWKEIVTKLEDSFLRGTLESTKDTPPFATKQAVAVWTAICSCWSEDIFIPQLSHRFWKLTLQIISRYAVWLDKSLPPLEPAPKVAAALAAEKASNRPSGIGDLGSTETIAAEDQLLTQCGAIMIDVLALQAQTMTLYRDLIFSILPQTDEDADATTHEEALKAVFTNLKQLVPPLYAQILTVLTRRACDALDPVKKLFQEFKASMNKKTPTEPSPFVSSVLLPIKNFFHSQSPGAALKDEYMESCSKEVFDNVCGRYLIHLTAIKKAEDGLRRLRRGQRTTFSLFGSSNTSAADNSRRDEQRLRTQMILDIDALLADAKSIDIDASSSPAYLALRNMVDNEFMVETD